MAERYPGVKFSQVMPLACLPRLSLLVTFLILGMTSLVLSFVGVHWLLVPGIYAVWLVTAIPHAFLHLIADRAFKNEAVTDWAGPVANIVIVLICYFYPVSIPECFRTIVNDFAGIITLNPFPFLALFLYVGNIWAVFQHLFLPWPANDPDVGLVTKLLNKKCKSIKSRVLTRSLSEK
ncbi:MAG: hypothetical protein HY537_12120 [Deltaproteobacteria bacterium]|nr:hypothetical protein [Deltaproteobacteria bacterium]